MHILDSCKGNAYLRRLYILSSC